MLYTSNSMDRSLKCNVFGCDTEVQDEAFVTTCSHIFCNACAAENGLASEDRNQRVCPACQTHLPNKHDVFQNYLNPSEDWKTNVLGGLSPAIIMECAGKALSFWGYQMTMEMAFLEGAHRRLRVEYDLMISKYEKALNEANLATDTLGKELEAVKLEFNHTRQENANLAAALKDKTRKLAQTQELYEKLKRKAMLEEIENAASHVVGSNLEAGNPHVSSVAMADHHPQQTHHQQQMYDQERINPRYNQATHASPNINGTRAQRPSPAFVNAYHGVLPSQTAAAARADMPSLTTPSDQRPRYAGPSGMGLSAVHGVVAGTPRGTPKGPPTANVPGAERMRQPYLDAGQVQKPPTRFSGVTLGAGVPRSHELPVSGPGGIGSSRFAVAGHASGVYDRAPASRTNHGPPPPTFHQIARGPGRY